MSSIDVAALVFLGLFLAWGAFHGALRQALGLLLLVAAFPIASATSESIESAVTKVVTLTAEGVACAAWVFAWFGVVVVGSVILRLVGGPLDRARLPGRLDALLGALLGFVKGALLLVLVVHVVLGWHTDPVVPSSISRLRTSRTAELSARVERSAETAAMLPPAVVVRVERVHRAIDAERRP